MGIENKDRGDAPRFRWLGSGPLPAELDLRRCGWMLDRGDAPGTDCMNLVAAPASKRPDAKAWVADFDADARRSIIVTRVTCASVREALLRAGFADAVGDGVGIGELEARATRAAELARWLPRLRTVGELRMDLLAREAYGRGVPLDLNPREFALIWRLADTPDRAVDKEALIRDVWRMGFVPATNSIAVHMSRLRRKLAFVGMNGMIETMPDGSYRLRATPEKRERADARRAAPSPATSEWRPTAL